MFDLARENSYPTPLSNSTLLPLMLISLATQKNSPSTTKTPATIFSEYDYIIVGAGSAGSTVAARLSEIPCVNVLLLEAGRAPPLLNDIPAFAKRFWSSDLDWKYVTVPQKHTGKGLVNRQLLWPSGKGLGGSSLLNSMFFVRGNKKNYDDWAEQGAEGWSYKDVLPYFKKLEDNKNPEFADSGYHGVGGPVTVENPTYHSEIKGSILAAAREIGYKVVDSNGPTQTGFNDFQGSTRRHQRCSTAKAYLVPAENRKNLHILPNAFVNKVILNGTKAVGVSFKVDDKLYEVKAKREVIMSAGTTNTAQLLMLSGIGPEKELVKHNIPVVADLPVGENLQNHCACILSFELSSEIPSLTDKLNNRKNIKEYIKNRKGPLSVLDGVSAMAFLNNRTFIPNDYYPSYQLYFAEGPALAAKRLFGLLPEIYKKIYAPNEKKPFYICYSQILKPKSRGSVTLQSSNPRDPPLIDPNYFADPSDIDEMVEGMKICKRIGTSESMKKVGSKPFNATFPGCEDFVANEDDYFRCQARSFVTTLSHQVGTARMGRIEDNSTVVDPQLRVKGIRSLRVVDASIMPIVPSGNTNYPTIMVAEKASDIIKDTIMCEDESESKRLYAFEIDIITN